jgi:hypothetical protein
MALKRQIRRLVPLESPLRESARESTTRDLLGQTFTRDEVTDREKWLPMRLIFNERQHINGEIREHAIHEVHEELR